VKGQDVYRRFQCLSPDCTATLVVRDDACIEGFSFPCEECGTDLYDGGFAELFDYALIEADSNTELASAKSQNTTLQTQAASFRGVTATYAAAAAAQAQLSTAMGDEVRYSQMLNDLSLTIPDNVWVKTITYVPVNAAAAAPAAGVTGAAPVATLSIDGVAFSHDDVAVLLDSLMGLKTYANAYFSNSTEALMGTRKVVNYLVTADVTPAARSGRYTKPVGG